MWPRRSPLLWAVLAALAVAGCAGSDGEADPGSSPTPAAEVDAAEGQVEPPPPATAEEAIEAFVAAWEANDWSRVAQLAVPFAGDPAADHAAFHTELEATATNLTVSAIDTAGDRAVAEAEVSIELDRLGTWTYPTTITAIDNGGFWGIAWEPSTLHPALVDGRTVQRLRVWPDRGELLAADRTPIRTDRPVVRVGVEPRRIEDQEQLIADLETILDVDGDRVVDDLEAPGVQPDWFVPVATLREGAFEPLRDQLLALPGVVAQSGTDRLAPTDAFARQVLGATGPITAEQLDAWGEPYDETSTVGRSGLELSYEPELAGTPTGEIRLLDADGSLLSLLKTFPGRPPVDVITSLDIETQAAAEATLDQLDGPAALVAIDAPTGEVRAMVSRPVDEFGRAHAGAYPPGSTFKTVTAASYLAMGATTASPVSCPAQTIVGGFPFTNADGLAHGSVSLQSAYALSCNTAFANISTEVSYDDLQRAGANFGFDTDYSVGVTTVGGSLPVPIDDAEHAASAIGQGRVTASPLHMATVAAAVAAGEWRQPTLLVDPAPDLLESRPLDSATAAALREMMRAVVTSGTGTAASGAGGDISGKTGSAEFGDGPDPETHAWFIGYRDELAFAVLVEGGGAGGAVAAPLAADFLARLDQARPR